MDQTNKIKHSSDSGNLLLLLKNGDSQKVVAIDGGGMMIGSEDGYEVFFVIDQHGTQESFRQTDIAAVIDLDDNCQVEFGNAFLSVELSDHPRCEAKLVH